MNPLTRASVNRVLFLAAILALTVAAIVDALSSGWHAGVVQPPAHPAGGASRPPSPATVAVPGRQIGAVATWL